MIGQNNPNYKNVDRTILLQMIQQGKKRTEIADFFGVTPTTISNKTRLYFGVNMNELRKRRDQDGA